MVSELDFVLTCLATPIGLTDEMVEEIKANDEFSEVLRLHNYVQKIKGKQELVGQQATELRTMFDSLIKRTALTTN